MSVWKAKFGGGDTRYLVVEVGPKDKRVKDFLRVAYSDSQGEFGALADLDKHAKNLTCVATIPSDLAHKLEGMYTAEHLKVRVENLKEYAAKAAKKAEKISKQASDMIKKLEL